jgi:signal peptidase II
MSPRLRHRLMILLTVLACVGCDQASKAVAQRYLPQHDASYLGDSLRLVYAENPGAFLSLGATLAGNTRQWILTVGASALLLGLIGALLIVPPVTAGTRMGLALMCGGGIGNLIDRWTHAGYVVDFLNVGVGSLRTGIFNGADMALMLGTLLVVIDAYRVPTSGHGQIPSPRP